MKILHTSDLHLGKRMFGYSLIEDQEFVLNDICEIAKRESVDAIVISGDVYDKSITSLEAIKLFSSFSSKVVNTLGIYLIVISGNHDSGLRLNPYDSDLLNKKFILTNDNSMWPVKVGDTNFYLAPFATLYDMRKTLEQEFQTTSDAYEYLIDNTVLKDGPNVFVGHDYFAPSAQDLLRSDSEREIEIGGTYFINGSILEKFDYAALGHLHNSQKVGVKNIRYSGSPMPYSFSEKLKKSVTIFDSITKDIKTIELKQLRKFVTIENSFENLLTSNFYSKYDVTNDYFKLKITDEEEIYSLYQRLSQVYKNLMEIEKNSTQQKTNGTKKKKYKSLDEALSDFYESVCDYSLTKEDKQILNNIIGGKKNENK